MNLNRIVALSLISIMALFPLLFCKRAEKGAPAEEAPATMTRNAPGMQPKKAVDESDGSKEVDMDVEKKEKSRGGLVGHFLAPMALAGERLLEYRVDLTYESMDLIKSRQEMLGIVAKYGFVKGSGASLESKKSFMASDVFVKSEKLYDALQEFDKVGILLAENISVTDHTENMVLQERKVKREQIRIGRKNAAAGQVTAAARNWNDIENSLEQSEDTLDGADHEKWKIKDKVAWAWIHVNFKGPDQPGRIEVPRYTDAFIGVANLFLGFLYVLIYILPLGILIWLVIWKRNQIKNIFKRKKDM